MAHHLLTQCHCLGKHVVVVYRVLYRTLDALYQPRTVAAVLLVGDELLAAAEETWQSLKDTFSLSVLANPIEASKGDGEMATGAMGVMSEKFGSASAAYSYLIFVLLCDAREQRLAAVNTNLERMQEILSP